MVSSKSGYISHTLSDSTGYIDDITDDVWKGGWKFDSTKGSWAWQHRLVAQINTFTTMPGEPISAITKTPSLHRIQKDITTDT